MADDRRLFSEATLRTAKKSKISMEELCNNIERRKQAVDLSFAQLMSKVLVPPPGDDFDVATGAKSTSLETTFTGRVVALLSTGETGIVSERPNSKCIVKLDNCGTEVKACWDELFWIKKCYGPDDAVKRIIKAVEFVPQVKDIKMGARVAVVKLHYQTGRITKLPESNKARCFTVELEHSGNILRIKAEGLRLIRMDDPVVGPLCEKRGRPKREYVVEQGKLRKPKFLLPSSKSTVEWIKSIRPPQQLPLKPRPVEEEAPSASDDEGSFIDDFELNELINDENVPFQGTEVWM
jgi:hypothetical protein